GYDLAYGDGKNRQIERKVIYKMQHAPDYQAIDNNRGNGYQPFILGTVRKIGRYKRCQAAKYNVYGSDRAEQIGYYNPYKKPGNSCRGVIGQNCKHFRYPDLYHALPIADGGKNQGNYGIYGGYQRCLGYKAGTSEAEFHI